MDFIDRCRCERNCTFPHSYVVWDNKDKEYKEVKNHGIPVGWFNVQLYIKGKYMYGMALGHGCPIIYVFNNDNKVGYLFPKIWVAGSQKFSPKQQPWNNEESKYKWITQKKAIELLNEHMSVMKKNKTK